MAWAWAWAVAGAAEPAVDLELVIAPGLRPAALAVPPLSLIEDPAAALSIAHVRRQLTALDRELCDDVGLLPAMMQLNGAVFQVGKRRGSQFDWLLDHAALVFDCGPAAEDLAQGMDTTIAEIGERAHWSGFAGYAFDPDMFVGRAGGLVVLGQRPLLAAPVQRLAELQAAPADPRIGLTWHLGGLFAGLAPGEHPLLDELLGAWRGGSPNVRVCAVPAADGWQGRVLIEDLGRLPLTVLDPDIAAAARSGWSITLGLHLEPSTVQHALAALGGSDWWTRAQLTPELLRQFTGDGLLQAGWIVGPFPTGAVLLRLHDGNEAAEALAAWADSFGAGVKARADADQAFSLMTAAGEILIARNGARLVVGTDPGLSAAWLAGAPGDSPLAADHIAQLVLDLPTVARQWLPLAWAAVDGVHEALVDDPLAMIDELVWELRETLRRVTPPASVSEALASPESLRHFFPGADLALAIDAACALYVPDPPLPIDPETPPSARLVLHFPAGFALFDGTERHTGLDPAALDAQLQGWVRLLGPEPAALVQVEEPTTVVFDHRWLPPLAVALTHVPTYHLAVTNTDFALRCDERGLPLASLATIAVALIWCNNLP